jgi:hypothetical protein
VRDGLDQDSGGAVACAGPGVKGPSIISHAAAMTLGVKVPRRGAFEACRDLSRETK